MFEKFRNFLRKTTISEILFNKVVGLESATLSKKDSDHLFPCTFCKNFNRFFVENPRATASTFWAIAVSGNWLSKEWHLWISYPVLDRSLFQFFQGFFLKKLWLLIIVVKRIHSQSCELHTSQTWTTCCDAIMMSSYL